MFVKIRSALNSSVDWVLATEGDRLFQCGIVRGEKEFLRGSLYVWCLRYWALCDDLVVFKLWAGVIYLSFSIDTAPQWILWKRSKEDWALRASRDGHSSLSSISLTLLVFCHLLQVQRAAVLWTFSVWLIWSFKWGLQMGAAYSSLGQTKVLYATSIVLLGAKILVALEEISETYWPQSMLSVMVIPRYFADWTFSKVWLCSEWSKRICLWCWCQVTLIEWHLATLATSNLWDDEL